VGRKRKEYFDREVELDRGVALWVGGPGRTRPLSLGGEANVLEEKRGSHSQAAQEFEAEPKLERHRGYLYPEKG